jgi:hypothetical protein
MAFFYTTTRLLVKERMALNNKDILKTLITAKFAKTSNKYFIAWTEPDEIAVLPPDHPKDKECEWLNGSESIEEAITFIESGAYAREPVSVINMFILNEKTGQWE